MVAENDLPGEEYKFDPRVLEKTIIAKPLLDLMDSSPNKPISIIIDLNLNYAEGIVLAGEKVVNLILDYSKSNNLTEESTRKQISINKEKNRLTRQYVFAKLSPEIIRGIIVMDRKGNPAIYKIWPDFKMGSQMIKSVRTIKADAARTSFSASGEEITWAVVDSGVDFSHPHFLEHKNRHSDYHKNFTESGSAEEDEFGHGTHVAGIIAGEMQKLKPEDPIQPVILVRSKNEIGESNFKNVAIDKISGMAPKCKIVSIKVLDSRGKGQTSSLIAAIAHIQEINNYGRELKIHGVNLSLGYPFDPEWFACGQSPVCVEVDRLVKSGVVVVVAAGNTGYGFSDTKFNGRMASGMPLSINDPGNAELAITVGATHRESPHTYGVSYFSSKGPTGDGRPKPDIIAPGEKIISCAAGGKKKAFGTNAAGANEAYYLEESGTSMAAPHVSGAIAAFLSVRREYIGQPEKLKHIFCSTATDLRRDPYFQGKGLVDLMRAIQSV
ncbi:S8 family peptidase [Pedobacter aquatilis]|uniref:S8 family peptidase n=1 Tax=Pedobacter aquatilis TaxID=351343 RepID=UPI0025B5D701|nr:S8 family peptidase [Pedobacter aquatilis]MDN3588200.1 S8 family peptidase [Pedobacter aquatilis]